MDPFRSGRDMNQAQPYSGGPPAADTQSFGPGNRGGFVPRAHPGSVSFPPPNWPPQPGPWTQFQPPVPSPFPPPSPLPSFDPTRPPPGYFGEQQHGGQWPHSASRGQQHGANLGQLGRDRGHFEETSFTHFGPPARQPMFQPVSSGSNVSADHYKPSLAFPTQFPATGGVQNILNQENRSTKRLHSDPDEQERVEDQQWIAAFLQRRVKTPAVAVQTSSKLSVSEFRQRLYSAVQMLSELTLLCQTLKNNLENEDLWAESYGRGMELKLRLQERLSGLRDPEVISSVKKKLELIKKKRARIRRRKAERVEERLEEERRAAEREAAIDKYQMKKIQELEEKNRERELKLAADSVLSEVRKKQADSKRMLDILKALEKLRKLRKEAASRKGMFPEKECDKVFEGHLARLRGLIQKRTAVYGAEEKALRVMLEGEQEEERKREQEKKQKKEREKLLIKKQEISTMLFGAELPPEPPVQPFTEYYTQAERSLPALIQIRREWDQFLVPADHSEGTSVPQAWVLPDPPADEIWASALEK
ncbi:programmed cell death protein 7 [Hoplias malabaricus]|uniref:programmed cell death protein 7 n=1 Tax=Hoplias malabaricus TaxID=27720 RepID=UPI003462500C